MQLELERCRRPSSTKSSATCWPGIAEIKGEQWTALTMTSRDVKIARHLKSYKEEIEVTLLLPSTLQVISSAVKAASANHLPAARAVARRGRPRCSRVRPIPPIARRRARGAASGRISPGASARGVVAVELDGPRAFQRWLSITAVR